MTSPSRTPSDLPSPIVQLCGAWNAHDLDALARCFDPDYESIQPFHPERNFRGVGELCRSWAAIFEAIPDFQAELLDFAVQGESVWTEWHWSGSHVQGGPFNARGILIAGLAGGRIVRARIYAETAQVSGPDWDVVLDEILNRRAASPGAPPASRSTPDSEGE